MDNNELLAFWVAGLILKQKERTVVKYLVTVSRKYMC